MTKPMDRFFGSGGVMRARSASITSLNCARVFVASASCLRASAWVFRSRSSSFFASSFMAGEHFAHAHEGAHNVHAHLGCARAVEHVSGLNRAVLGEGKRWKSRIAVLLVQRLDLGAREPEHEVFGESSLVALDLLIEALGRHAVEFGQRSGPQI